MNPFLHVIPILAQVDATATGDFVTLRFDLSQVLTAVIVGLIAGALASVLVRGRRFSFLGSIILGILGAIVGGFVFSLLNIQIDPLSTLGTTITIRLVDILVAFIGALIILVIYIALFGRRNL
jgi:uncharacterized membrane protein YeaQ/YmgE (transglycosylase-associated protein family)